MIPANKRPMFRRVFYAYLKRVLIKKHFGKVTFEGALDVPTPEATIYIINHSSWWDGLMLYYLTESLSQQDHYVMMDEEGLTSYPFFRKLGAFSVNRRKPRDLIQTFQYMDKLFDQGHPVWIFPQGKVEHQEKLPYQFEKGIGRIIKMRGTVTVKPITFHYYFPEEQKPVLSIKAGDPVLAKNQERSRSEWTSYFEAVLTKQYTEHKKAIVNDINYHKREDLIQLKKQSSSISDWLDRVKKVFK
ncbi:1-acyl-sn-glycerol-3-phosphate acyltransferase [Pelagirhabdus alkalitolerans]|uniref:1-acyl-sn-glycerol-3-phosphate acyltransferase n=1 Tax=Pelagirhabdus alkalitolerans TaxID=1612202 RepID=A0A1G6H9J3_9BACI|nr:lysophospholipid acyltransferase family protein [Pelagirhabdus alkalitolerans]SDB90615.1 1-acyl-sn-glycerol-3-phosphate acyltransferase [Pelagirhabdus alkalitolerans]